MDPRIVLALRIMKENYGTKLTVSSVSTKVGLSTSRFEHLFTKEVGSTFRHCLAEIRLENGSRLLTECTLSVKEVSAKVGYSWLPNFCRDFKRRFGATPAEFKTASLTRTGGGQRPLAVLANK